MSLLKICFQTLLPLQRLSLELINKYIHDRVKSPEVTLGYKPSINKQCPVCSTSGVEMKALDQVHTFAYRLEHDLWNISSCQEDIVVVYSRDDQAVSHLSFPFPPPVKSHPSLCNDEWSSVCRPVAKPLTLA